MGRQHARGFFAATLIEADWTTLRVLSQWRLHRFQLAGKLPRQGGLLPGPSQVTNVVHLIGGEQTEHVREWPGFHPRSGALPKRRQRRVVSRPRRGSCQAQRSSALPVIQLAVRRHDLGRIGTECLFRPRPVIGPFQNCRPRFIRGRGIQRTQRRQGTIGLAEPRMRRGQQQRPTFGEVGRWVFRRVSMCWCGSPAT